MSLQISLEVQGATQPELKAIAAALPKAGKLTMRTQKDSLFFWKLKGFSIEGVGDGLKEGATARNETFPLETEIMRSLGEILASFWKVCPRRFSLYASLSGDLPKRETDIQFSELLELISEGHLGNRVTYRVRPDVKKEVEVAPSPDVAEG